MKFGMAMAARMPIGISATKNPARMMIARTPPLIGFFATGAARRGSGGGTAVAEKTWPHFAQVIEAGGGSETSWPVPHFTQNTFMGALRKRERGRIARHAGNGARPSADAD